MKKKYTSPIAKMVDFSFDEQVAAVSVPKYCKHYMGVMTVLNPTIVGAGGCEDCNSDILWIDSVSPW